MINRAALILRFKQAAVDWINESEPHDDSLSLKLSDVNHERTVYLVPDHAGDDDETVRAWVELNYRVLFENELGSWYPDESLFPKEPSLGLFDEYFDVECHTIIIDTLDEPIIEELNEYDDDEIH